MATIGCSSSSNGSAPAAPANTPAPVATLAQAATVAPTASPTPEAYALALTVTASNKAGDPCGGGYNLEGAAVTVRDEHGTIIAAGTTGRNVRPEPTPYPYPNDTVTDRVTTHLSEYSEYVKAAAVCRVQATLPVPRAAFYQLTVGSHAGPTHSFDELRAMGWKLDLSLQ